MKPQSAVAAGLSYRAWLAQTARKELTIRAGLGGVAEFEAEYGAFTPDELTEANRWVDSTLPPS